ncbi:hypothetical protein QGM71_11495 [Virgibacillus sp. C22-A2]|uniref:General stress protein 17M-like domain-containing protein n=1 Tax=Virgibacillus tibetensis TaxID=3042313 RepID=A0ABU6KFM7_9BACI|nr:hypothetical protein [Virgibacillus sp. C22-A2]
MENILAYFKSENDAESARANLQRLQVSSIIVDKLPETEGQQTFVPLFTVGSTTTSTGIVGTVSNNGNEGDHGKEMTYLVEGKVKPEDYEEALQILAESKGYKNNE